MISRPEEPRRFAVLAVVALVIAGGGGYLVFLTIAGLGPSPCNANDAFSGWRTVLLAGGAFVAGHLFRWRHYDLRHLDETPAHPRRVALVTHSVLALFLAGVVIILVYESISLWNPPGTDSSPNPWGLHPITHYVRCAKSVSPIRTTAIAMVVSFFIGHWLWPQQPRQRSANGALAPREDGNARTRGEK